MNPKKQTSKQLPITKQTQHQTVRAFLLSQSKRVRILIGRALSPQQRVTLFVFPKQQTQLTAPAGLGCLSVNGEPTGTLPALSQAESDKGVKTGAKQRLWDRPFCKSKFKQQGSPTISAGRARPTNSPPSPRRKRPNEAVLKCRQHTSVRTFPHFQRGNHER